MVGELITFPLRVGVRATQLWLRAAEGTVAIVAGTTGKLIDRVVASGSRDSDVQFADPEPAAEPSPAPAVARAQPAAAPAPAVPPMEEPAPEPEPAHVSEEPELVEEFADPGAEDGAGAAVRIEAPWEGYDEMKAADVIERLGGSDSAELAAIQLYENGHKGRSTVLDAVERELRISTGSGSQS